MGLDLGRHRMTMSGPEPGFCAPSTHFTHKQTEAHRLGSRNQGSEVYAGFLGKQSHHGHPPCALPCDPGAEDGPVWGCWGAGVLGDWGSSPPSCLSICPSACLSICLSLFVYSLARTSVSFRAPEGPIVAGTGRGDRGDARGVPAAADAVSTRPARR